MKGLTKMKELKTSGRKKLEGWLIKQMFCNNLQKQPKSKLFGCFYSFYSSISAMWYLWSDATISGMSAEIIFTSGDTKI